MADVQGQEGGVIIREGSHINGKGPAFTSTESLDVSPAVETTLDITTLVGSNVVITGFYMEGDAANDFEVSLKTQVSGSTVWFLAPASARSFSLAGLWVQQIFLRSAGVAMDVKVLLTLAIQSGILPPIP
ncbi:hypothetical protein LCGC14_0583810 [marine sediment metagenome]|uniref:Uncharacterized protein n=1 Tax=marine sediment metagenome TaxID=412755 RepID=A0A0F9RFL6_9ZZZZ